MNLGMTKKKKKKFNNENYKISMKINVSTKWEIQIKLDVLK